MSKILVIVGRPRSGKSTKAKEVVLRTLYPDTPDDLRHDEVELLYRALRGSEFLRRLLVYDVNKEWTSAPLPTMDAFLKDATRSRDKLIVIEEATLFFDPSKGRSDELREMLVRKRHTGNALVLLFHALADVPLYVVRMADTLVLFKTQDTADDLRRIRHLHPVLGLFDEVRKSYNEHAFGEFDFLTGAAIFNP